MELRERRELYNGFGETLARAVEFVAAPGVFAWLGHLLDRATGTSPLFTIVLALLALAGTFVRAYYAYDTAMRQHEAERPWARPAPAPAPGGPS